MTGTQVKFEERERCFACGGAGELVGRFRYPKNQAGFVPEPWMTTWCGSTATLSRCTSCGSQWPERRPAEALLSSWYGAQDYTDDDYVSNGHRVAAGLLAERFAGSRPLVVDVGTGSGAFLDLLPGMTAVGLEPSRTSVAAAQARGRDVHVPDEAFWSPRLPPKVDAITLFDVVEHLREPRDVLSGLSRRLVDGGLLLIFTGDAASPWARAWGTRWWYHGWAGHISCFSARGLRSVLASCGLRVVHEQRLVFAPPPLALRARIRAARSAFTVGTWSVLRNREPPVAACPGGADHMLLVAQSSQAGA